MRRKIKIAIIVVVIAAAIGGVAIWAINEASHASEFMYMPSSFTPGENAYERGWKSVGSDPGVLQFTAIDACGSGCKVPALKLTTTSLSTQYAVRFDFRHSYFVVTRFSIFLDGGTSSGLVINAVIMQFNQRVATIPITVFEPTSTHRIEVNNTNLVYTIDGSTIIEQPISEGGMDGLILEVTGFSGDVSFLQLRGQRLDD